MPAIGLVAGDLLEYNSKYSLLICRQCQYAIQKNALESHLLRHKIYRSDRQCLLTAIAQLHLLEPQNVTLPAPGLPPVDALPVLSGYRCTAAACQHLTVSSKRMKRHWSDIHRHGGSVPLLASFARPVKLQTFFRGTQVRYFEVASLNVSLFNASDDGNDDGDDDEDDDEGCEEKEPDAITAIPPSPPRVPASPGISHGPSPIDFSLETLTYFHHFTMVTSLTLPGAIKDSQSGKHHWQTHVVVRALRRHWLMCGLLAISTYHLAALADDIRVKQIHLERGQQFTSEFSTGLQQTTGRNSDQEAATIEEESKKIGQQINCLLRCAQWALVEPAFNEDLVAPHRLLSVMAAIRGCVVPNSTLRHSGIWSDGRGRQEESSIQGFLHTINASHGVKPQNNSFNDTTPSVLLGLLRALPFRMAEVFGRPEGAEDIFATLSAIMTVAECCEISFACNGTEMAWQGVATWLAQVPDHFNQMVGRDDPAALVVLAHWAAILVKRAEHVGCWLLKGSAKLIVLQITRRLSVHGHAILNLVECLMDMVND